MTEPDCESVCMAAMALGDGYTVALTPEQIETHLAGCSACRREVEQLNEISNLLDSQKRSQPPADLWPQVEGRLKAKAATAVSWHPFLALGLLLMLYKVFVMLPGREISLLLKLAPVALIAAVFIYLKENPFKISLELDLKPE